MKTHTSYTCSYCEQSFDKKNECKQHEEECVVVISQRNERDNKIKDWQEKISNAQSLKDVEVLLVEYAKDVYDIKLEVNLNVKWNNMVSNTHHCPRGGKTNWGRNENYPLGYAGWSGRVTGKDKDYDKRYCQDNFCRDIYSMFGLVGVHTGTGGGGINYQYGVSIFADDFPMMKEKVEELKELYRIQTAQEDEKERLYNKAEEELIDNNKEYHNFTIQISDLEKQIKDLKSERLKLGKQIQNSDEFKQSTTPSEEFDYDKDRLRTLSVEVKGYKDFNL